MSRYQDWDESDVRVRPNKRGSRPRTKDRPAHERAKIGRVITVDRGRYTVILEEDTAGERVVVAARARELRRQAIVPGDMVALVGDTSGKPDTLARLVRIEERSTLLRRSADDTDATERVVVANVDQLVIVVAAANPEPRTGFVDRALVAAFDAGITPILCVTKADVADPAGFLAHYDGLDLPVVISRTTAEADGIDSQAADGSSARLDPEALATLRTMLAGKVSVVLGHSGVGKSTLVNALTGAQRATGHVNAVTGRGRHTSSNALALRLPDAPGSWLIDTPGIRSFGLGLVDPEHVLAAFEELSQIATRCPRGCDHMAQTPGCALQAWAYSPDAPASAAARLESYRRLVTTGETTHEKELGAQ
ncbi:ribosome small subunit-dependent GTPase A [Glutamicibacter creatinolyticus]|uniref:ribosome small subunit-dependent GTPase A n=1 Tax=Glutamicibacter creatinolyticus TaxID=162496 RepID=UPI0032166793